MAARQYFGDAPRLTPSETLAYLQLGTSAFDELLLNSKLIGRSGRVFKSSGDTASSEFYFGYASTAINETFAGVRTRYMNLVRHRDEYCRVFSLEDTRVLCVLQSPGVRLGPWHEPSSALVLLRWMARKPTQNCAKAQDFVVLEYIDTIVNTKGERCWGRLWHSVVLPSFPPQYGFERGALVHSGDILVENSTGKTVFGMRLMLYDVASMKSRLPKWVTERIVRRQVRQQYQCHLDRLLWDHVVHDDLHSDETSEVIELGDDDFFMLECTIKYVSTECDLCSKRFGMFRSRFACFECEKTICRRCSIGFNDTLRNRTMTDVKRTRMCVGCYGPTSRRRNTAVSRS
ncbi:hypothetical protein ACHHYP_05689 [Achlya hypogyna]|uniref:FYVE-type domain-containing protein n=1 Tax=Achlya hypogyna TaxID=1202772 RepID=A0A1V9YWU4_ACHHY|nr:hypothetical protein ACHHYP_05689 [Achlya hypogyna]